MDYELALEEPLPAKPLTLPETAPHLTELLKKKNLLTAGIPVLTKLQQRCNQLVANHSLALKENQIHNLAALVIDVETNTVVAYVGNSPTAIENDPYVDIIQRNRSTGVY